MEYKYNEKDGKFTENGHTMFESDVLQRLKRLAYLEEQIKLQPTEPDKEESKCRECGGAGKASKGLKNKFVGSNDDFGNDAGQEGTTMSLGKDADLIDCLKCIDCGHSWV